MLNLLLDATTNPQATPKQGSWVIYVILIALVVVMLVLPTITNKRRMKEYNTMLDQLRVGDEVRTIGGIIGRVTKISNKGEVKTFTLETGSKGSKTTMEFDLSAVGTVLKSTYVAEEPVKAKEEKKEEKVEEKKEETPAVEEVKVEETAKTEEVKEEKKEAPAKKSSRKTSKKKEN